VVVPVVDLLTLKLMKPLSGRGWTRTRQCSICLDEMDMVNIDNAQA
jgi:hypothetical protein